MRLFRWLAVALLLPLAACGGDVVVGGFTGRVDGSATSTNEAAASPAVAPVYARQAAGAPSALVPQGTIRFVVALALTDEQGRDHAVAANVLVPALRIGLDSLQIGSRHLPVGSYTRARLAFSQISVDLTGGVTVPGLPLPATITVEQGAQPIAVDVPIQLVVRQGETHRVVVDLRAVDWLTAATIDPLRRSVGEASFRAAVRVRVHG